MDAAYKKKGNIQLKRIVIATVSAFIVLLLEFVFLFVFPGIYNKANYRIEADSEEKDMKADDYTEDETVSYSYEYNTDINDTEFYDEPDSNDGEQDLYNDETDPYDDGTGSDNDEEILYDEKEDIVDIDTNDGDNGTDSGSDAVTTLSGLGDTYEDFEWFRRIVFDKEKPGDLFPDGKIIRSKDEIVGTWESYMTDDPKGTFASVMDADIYTEGDDITLVLYWKKRMYEGSGEVIDMAADPPTVLKGKLTDDLTKIRLDSDRWYAVIGMFFAENGRQYGSASYYLKKSGGESENLYTIAFTREI